MSCRSSVFGLNSKSGPKKKYLKRNGVFIFSMKDDAWYRTPNYWYAGLNSLISQFIAAHEPGCDDGPSRGWAADQPLGRRKRDRLSIDGVLFGLRRRRRRRKRQPLRSTVVFVFGERTARKTSFGGCSDFPDTDWKFGHRPRALKWPFIENDVLWHRKYFTEKKQYFDEMYTHEILHRNISSNQSPPNTN